MGETIGILGGSFDPVHLGHIQAACEARDRLDLDRVLLVPAALQPLKVGREAAPPADRLAMLRLALAAAPDARGLEVCALEVEREGPSYTVDTLEALAAELGPEVELVFLAGSDVLDTLAHWHRLEDILRLARFCVVSRPGAPRAMPAGLAGKLAWVEIEARPVSSSEVRARLAAGRSVAGLLAPAVEDYIRARGLYGAERGSLQGERL